MYYRHEVGEIGRICEVDTLDFREVDTNISNMNEYLYWHVLWEVGRPGLEAARGGVAAESSLGGRKRFGWLRSYKFFSGCLSKFCVAMSQRRNVYRMSSQPRPLMARHPGGRQHALQTTGAAYWWH